MLRLALRGGNYNNAAGAGLFGLLIRAGQAIPREGYALQCPS